jgi:hypothetical protein
MKSKTELKALADAMLLKDKLNKMRAKMGQITKNKRATKRQKAIAHSALKGK